MSRKETITCPDCACALTIDLDAGVIVSHQPAVRETKKIDFDSKLAQIEQERSRASDRMEEAMRREQSKDRIMEDRFKQLMDDAKTKPITGKPLRDIDLD